MYVAKNAEGDEEAAKPFVQRALDIYDREFGGTHPDTLKCKRALGVV